MAIRDLKDQIARLPEQPGVYLYFNAAGDTIYVGKARALRDRVRNYLGAYGSSPKTDALLDEIARLEFIVTDSVVEALALENNLIKQRSPRYNILLRDDKNYPYLQLTTTESFPRVLVARGVERDGNFYAGPFMPARFARKTMALTHRLFGLRSCNEVITGDRHRPCLEYDIKRCIAPCVASICSPAEYGRAVQLTRLFLEGRNDELTRDLRARMLEASEHEHFEEAAQIRDAIRTIQTLEDRQQKMATVDLNNRDVFGMKVGAAGAAVQVFQVRGGRVVERVDLGSETAIVGRDEGEVLAAAVQQFYEFRIAPSEVHVPVEPEERDALETWLSQRDGHRVRLVVPQRGDKRGLVDLANRNAGISYQSRFNTETAAQFDALETLQRVLALSSLPRRIECFDISTFQGSETVASMVVCEDGRMKRGEYRKFRVKGTAVVHHQGPGESGGIPSADAVASIPLPRDASAPRVANDFASMHEVVRRRYRRLLEEGGPFPDLVLIDGGKGQLSAAYAALEELGLANLVAVGIAKKEELLFTRDHDEPIALKATDPALLLIQRIRDEAHRFAVTFHRKARTMRDLGSELDRVPGVGPRRRRQLLTTFGSLAGVRRATREELASVIGVKLADAILAFFAGQP
ncbi:MAG TPA: excinuclease ABC subunit UvrC [Vicinamibacterales bacterium]|nr:excinuclease ABC subunit UvrC [Vicinamibacterales bacterium]